MATTEDPETLADVLRQAHDLEATTEPPTAEEDTPENDPNPQEAASLHARARKAALAVAARSDASLTPAGDAMRVWLRTHASEALAVYVEALSATKGDRMLGEIPDYNVRVKAADALLNRAEGMPVTRTELTGADGGPLTLQALLAADVRDTE